MRRIKMKSLLAHEGLVFGLIKTLGNLSCIYVAISGEHGRGKLLPQSSIEKVRMLDDPKPFETNSPSSILVVFKFEVELFEEDFIWSLCVENVVHHNTDVTGGTGAGVSVKELISSVIKLRSLRLN